jgi:hypothetical protein
VTITRSNPYQITSGTHFRTERGAATVTTNGLADSGTFYDGRANDGSISQFLFGSTSAFDVSGGFEQLSDASGAASAVFRVSGLDILQPPTIDTYGGPRSLTLVSQGGMVSSGSGGTWNLAPYNGLTLAAQNGSINLLSNLNFSGTTTNLFVYARGAASDLTLAAPITLTTGTVRLFGERNVALNGAYNTSGLVAVNAGNAINLAGLTFNSTSFTAKGATFGLGPNGRINAQSVNIETSGAMNTAMSSAVISAPDVTLRLGGTFNFNTSTTTQLRLDLSGLRQLSITADSIAFAEDFTAPAGSAVSFTIRSGGLNANQRSLLGLTELTVNGSVKLHRLSVQNLTVSGGNLHMGNTLRVENGYVSGNLGYSGTITPWSNGTGITQNVLQIGGLYETGVSFDFSGAAGTATAAPGHGSSFAFIAPTITINSQGFQSFNGGDAVSTSGFAGGSGGAFYLGLERAPAGSITISNALNATTGANATGVATGGEGGEIGLIANGTINVGSNIKVSESAAGRASNSGGRINIKSNATTGTAISVSSSSQLLSLLNSTATGPGGSIKFTSAGGTIAVSGTTRADKGTIEMTNNGASGAVNLTDATLNASTVKAAALGDNGQLNIGGGSISADTLISLYAGGSNGTVNFTDNISLNGTSVKNIAGNTVRIAGGKVVTVNGNAPANVFTNNPNYTGSGGNGTSTGTFAGQGATTQPLSAAPGR